MQLTKHSDTTTTTRRPAWATSLHILGAAALGALNTLSFAPTPGGGWLELLIVAAAFLVLQRARSTAGAAFRLGAFGFGNFVTGVWWLYVSMHDYGGLAAPLAWGAVVLFALYLAIYPALAGALWYRVSNGVGWRSSVAFAAAWTIGEWLRGLMLTGFPWLSSGYPQVDGPLAGLSSIFGVYGVGFAVALVAALLVQTVLGWKALPNPAPREPKRHRQLEARRAERSASTTSTTSTTSAASAPGHEQAAGSTTGDTTTEPPYGGDADDVSGQAAPRVTNARPREKQRPSRARLAPVIVALCVLIGGMGVSWIQWTHPGGSAISVRLLQGNVPQSMKFEQAGVDQSVALYQSLITSHAADLIVTPETAIPLLVQDLPEPFVQTIRQFADQTQSALLFGAFGAIMTDQGPTHIKNSLFGLTPRKNGVYQYDKHHLVPFGEFVPTGFHWFVEMMKIPLGDSDSGPALQQPFTVKDTTIAPDICYEDIFGEEIADSLRHQVPRARILVNTSNLGWFGNTIALEQHLQMARMRSIETGRPMLSSTNTGITAMIDASGEVAGRLTPFTVGSLMGTVQGMDGLTPYIVVGNWPVISGSILLLVALAWRVRRDRTRCASRVDA
ncbi:Apolipoprotein N-acyltransferase [Pararobbsia alpina]|uniref:apolipoprotein N-acyltransferase n=1 Tax=Pararobbsia alpina TaxID=621374 RepID=UPI0039A649DF